MSIFNDTPSIGICVATVSIVVRSDSPFPQLAISIEGRKQRLGDVGKARAVPHQLRQCGAKRGKLVGAEAAHQVLADVLVLPIVLQR